MSSVTDLTFQNYFQDINYDEMLSPSMDINPTWEKLFTNINKIGFQGLDDRQKDLDWYLTENGVTYNVYNDPLGLNRPWKLNVMPTLINEYEWQTIEKGVKQRAEILNLLFKDIYGKRELIKNGIIPQEVIYSHRGFLRSCDQITYNTTKDLPILSSDLARGPDGRMWVINDRTQAPSGMGYALENRLTMGRVLPDLFNEMDVQRLSPFFKHVHQLLHSTTNNKENPNIVVLTPGPLNETYFEHAYLASFFGFPLVQGNDLIVRNGFLWMKSLKGLKRVDVVWRRVDDMYIDPLELRSDSQLGVAGILDVVRRQNVTILNPIGTRVLENPGLIPFMRSITKYFLNEDLILPQIATWWCGQEIEKKYVLNNISNLIIKRIDRSNVTSVYFGETLSSSEQEDLRRLINDRPYRFVAQERIGFSTTPTFENGHFEPRNSVWRSFAIAHDNEYSVMPGGLVRVAAQRGNINVSNQKGGTSKDIWIINNKEHAKPEPFSWNHKSNISASGIGDLPSLTAENLFWAGRYVGRTLVTARFLRMVLKQMAFVQYNEHKPNSQGLQLLYQAVTNLTYTYPGFFNEEDANASLDPHQEILSVILDSDRPGGLSHTISMFKSSIYAIRNLWSADMWRVFERIEKIWFNLQNDTDHSKRRIIQALDQIITRLMAFMGLIEESILIEQGLLLYFIGLQLEQSMLTISKCRSLLVDVPSDQVEYEVLESLLNSHESLKVYRYTYRSYITPENVIELLLLDPKYPRSLAHMLNRLNKDLAELPHSKKAHQFTTYQKSVFRAFSEIRLANQTELAATIQKNERIKLDTMLSGIYNNLLETSKSLTDIYFSHTMKQSQLVKQNFDI